MTVPAAPPLPQSPDAERGLLCAFLLHQQGTGAIVAELGITMSHFFHPWHGGIFGVLVELWSENLPSDFLGLTQILRDRSMLDRCGGAAYVTDIFTFTPTAAYARRDAQILRDKLTLRQIIAVCTDHASRGYNEQHDVEGILDGLAAAVGKIARGLQERDEKTWPQLLKDKWERITNDEPEIGILKTGINVLDKHSPLRLGSMPLITGEEKSGKSILAIAISANVAKDGGAVLYFSLEDPASRVVDRFFANMAQLAIVRHSAKWMNEGELSRAENATRLMKDWRFTLHSDVFDLTEIVAVVRQKKATQPELALVVVDYAQLVRGRQRGENREQEVAHVSRTLRLLGIELNVAMLVLCQLNKDGDARESTSLQKDMTAMWKITVPDGEEATKRFITIPRQRDGESGIFRAVAFFGAQSRIESLVDDDKEPEQPAERKRHGRR